MNIGYTINEEVYNRVWENIWSECRRPILDQTTPLAHVTVYDSSGLTIDDMLRGHIALEINKNIMQIKL
jgi:hypothetical protein